MDAGAAGHSVSKGDKFTMPGSATVCITVTDNDAFLSGDNRKNENANDHSYQTAKIEDLAGNELGNGGQIYAEKYWVLHGSDGQTYYLIEIEQENGNAPGEGDDYFAFYGDVPPAGVELTVGHSCNVTSDWLDFKCLSAGLKWELDEECTYTIEAEDLEAHNFQTVHGENASGNELVKIKSHDGKLATDFGGTSGEYDIKLHIQDESDGISHVEVFVDGHSVGTIRLDQDDDGRGSNNGGFSEFALKGVDIDQGDRIEIKAWKDGGEFVRIDKIEFTQVKEPEFRICDDPEAVNIDFEGFAAGTVIDDEYAGVGVTITAQRDDNNTPDNDAMVFDSANPSGGDNDLATAAQGNILIISEDNDSSDPDDAIGGTITFTFDNPSFIYDIKAVDTEEGGTINLTLEDGSTQSFVIPEIGDGDIQQVLIDVDNVVEMEIVLNGSGAIDDLCFVPGQPEPGALSGTYFCDDNRNDINDETSPVEGKTVTLFLADGVTPATDIDGNPV
ncbi:MAG: hypothetical protein AAGB04_21495, partial [Pseudomonadota bacterium]